MEEAQPLAIDPKLREDEQPICQICQSDVGELILTRSGAQVLRHGERRSNGVRQLSGYSIHCKRSLSGLEWTPGAVVQIESLLGRATGFEANVRLSLGKQSRTCRLEQSEYELGRGGTDHDLQIRKKILITVEEDEMKIWCW